MLYPSSEEFARLSREYGRVVVYREIAGDMITPISLLDHFSDEDYLFLLESANLDKSFSRYTFFGFRPKRVIYYQEGRLIVESRDAGIQEISDNPVDYIIHELEGENSSKEPDFGDFCGGYVGFLGYDMVNNMNVLRKKIQEEPEDITMALFQVDHFYVFDNSMGKLYAACSIVSNGDPAYDYLKAGEETLAMAREILNVHQAYFLPDDTITQKQDFEKEAFVEKVQELREEIIRGECIQTVISNKYEIECSINPIDLYRLLRNINPSPYMFYQKMRDTVLCGTSPEIHLKISDNTAILKPIAGTYKIDGPDADVEAIKEALLKDEKERAEHLMLLDLARNDLYTGCEPESVTVTASFEPEVYSHLIHIVSEVQGKVRKDMSPMRLFCNTFPAGTVSGAPKVRAIELIDEYEASPRGFYAGCAGYFSYSQDIDTCIIIRSAYVKKDSVILRAGAGIVYDSNPEKEFLEVESKLGALFQAIKNISTLEKKNVFND